MATIQELLDADWDRKETTEAIMGVRAALQNLQNVADQTKMTIDQIIAEGSFGSVHADLKAEGQACRTLLSQFIAAIEGHAEFIQFKPDQ